MKPRVSIVGAGLVGSLWAVLLRQRGFEVQVFEKRSDIRKIQHTEERSINLVITSRGLNGLKEAGLLDEALKRSVPIKGRMIHSRVGEMTYQPYGNASECNFSISRSDLNKFLLDAAESAGAQIFFDHSLEKIDFHKRALSFEKDQATYTYDLLFGTDGAGSKVRKNLCQEFPNEFTERVDWLEADYKELFLPANSNGQPPIEKNALHIWPRGHHMMMALANLDGSFTVTLYMKPKGATPSFESVSGTKSKVENYFNSEFPDATSLMPTYSEDFLRNPQGRLGTVRCSKWAYKDSVVLMGDAAHAIVPFFGQGMNCGFEDCLNYLKILDKDLSQWKATPQQFEKIQMPNANAIADLAIENWHEMSEKVGDQKFLLRKKVEAALEQKFPEAYKSRYGMVTYTLIPYSQCQAIGEIQSDVLDQLTKNISFIDDLNWELADQLVHGELLDYVRSHNMTLETDHVVRTAKTKALGGN